MSKSVNCCVCGVEVSKRQSLSIGTGRCCRSHDEAASYVQEQEMVKHQKQGDDNFTILMTVESIRCILTVRPDFPLSLAIHNVKRALRKSGKDHLIDRIVRDIEKKGKLSDIEISNAVSTWSTINRQL